MIKVILVCSGLTCTLLTISCHKILCFFLYFELQLDCFLFKWLPGFIELHSNFLRPLLANQWAGFFPPSSAIFVLKRGQKKIDAVRQPWRQQRGNFAVLWYETTMKQHWKCFGQPRLLQWALFLAPQKFVDESFLLNFNCEGDSINNASY